jgi:tripartite-type tricarboxylate transporter receptor subunit TctC
LLELNFCNKRDRKKRFMKDALRLLVAAAGATLLAVPAQAQGSMQTNYQDYPSKPVTIVVPFGPGSGTDVITRIIAQPLSISLKQTVVIEDKPGANGAIAATQVARSMPDGHTLLMSTNSPHSAALTLNRTLAYDPVKDFAPLSRVGSYTFMVAVHRDLAVSSIAELIAFAKANPGKLSYASGNTSGIVAGATLKQRTGIDMLHVPYKTVPQAMNDALAGRVSVIFADLTTGLPHIQSGALRALAVTRIRRSTLLPDVPSLHEAGVENFNMDSWAGMFAPANTPIPIAARLNVELRRIIDDPEVKARMGTLGFEAFSSTAEELGEFVKVQLVEWTKMIKDAGIEAE